MANAFAYWQGKEIGAGARYTDFDDVQKAFGRIQQVCAGSRRSWRYCLLTDGERSPARRTRLSSGMAKPAGRRMGERTTRR